MKKSNQERHPSPMRGQLYDIIFGVDTPTGQGFDILLLWTILLSVLAVLLESVAGIRSHYGQMLTVIEWGFTGLFTVEYFLRFISVRQPRKYIFSFFGVVDLLSLIPTYLSLIISGTHSLIVIRALRLLRVFRVFKLARYVGEARILMQALRASRIKITVFLTVVLTLTLMMGTLMYLIEGEANGFTSIPRSMYWAIVTMTTVGYGDMAPKTICGQILASMIMILGYAIIVVPMSLFSMAVSQEVRAEFPIPSKARCPHCGRAG